VPLHVELDDGKRWRVCASRSRLQVKLRWTELEHPLLDPVRDVIYHHRTTRWVGVPVSHGHGVLTRAEGETAWTGTISVEAGRFFSRRIRFVVEDARDPPRAAGVRLVTKVSAALALGLLVAALVTLAWRGAATLSTLHLNFSYSHAVTGLGGLTLLAIAAKAVHTVTEELRVHGLPFWGLGYLLGRTAAACLLGACTLGVLLPNCVTTVVNETEANIELKLPSSPGRLVLGPDQQITFLGRVDYVGPTVQSSFAEEDRYCVVDERGLALSLGRQGPLCEPSPRPPELPGSMGWLHGLFSPAPLRVACSARWYEVLQGEGDEKLSSAVIARDLPGVLALVASSPGIPIELDARCQAKGPGRAVVERSAGEGFDAQYELTEPTTLAEVERSSRLVVQSASSVPLRLRLAAPAVPASPDPAAAPPVPGPVLTLAVQKGSYVSVAIPTPHPPEVDELSVIVSASSVELGSVSCLREHTDAESHFRLVALPLDDPYSRLLEVGGRSTGAPGWTSRWRELRPDFPIDASPMLCAVATGSGEAPAASGVLTALASMDATAVPAATLKLTLDVTFPRFGDRVVLTVPAEYAARRIEVVARNDAGPVARGTLDCVLPELAEGAAYELSPVWVRDARGQQVRRLRELELGQAGQVDALEATEVAAGRPCRPLHSRWVTELDAAASGRDGWFPPWICRPAQWDQATCRNPDGRPVVTPDPVVAYVETNRPQSADVALSEGTARLHAVQPKTCYFDRDTKSKRGNCPVRCMPRLDGFTRDAYNRDFGLSCQVIYECADHGEPC
jgi:hypothetical protein